MSLGLEVDRRGTVLYSTSCCTLIPNSSQSVHFLATALLPSSFFLNSILRAFVSFFVLFSLISLSHLFGIHSLPAFQLWRLVGSFTHTKLPLISEIPPQKQELMLEIEVSKPLFDPPGLIVFFSS